MTIYGGQLWNGVSVARLTDVKPDILIIDEVLSVGDESFQHKSAARMQEFRELGATILFVSHSMPTIEEMCHQAVWLDHGHLMEIGEPKKVIQAYRQHQT